MRRGNEKAKAAIGNPWLYVCLGTFRKKSAWLRIFLVFVFSFMALSIVKTLSKETAPPNPPVAFKTINWRS